MNVFLPPPTPRTLLKPQMIMPGVDSPSEGRPRPEEAARRTLEALRRRVPPAVPGVVFLSGKRQGFISFRVSLCAYIRERGGFSHTLTALPVRTLPPLLGPSILATAQADKQKNKPRKISTSSTSSQSNQLLPSGLPLRRAPGSCPSPSVAPYRPVCWRRGTARTKTTRKRWKLPERWQKRMHRPS